jgi:GntR family transcriptional repressor for pyruvate dehydrogenase complex
LTERAETQLEALVVERTYLPGEKLPSESEMGRLLGVSRTVVREAVRKLVARGLVEARNGSGIYARALGAALVQQPLELLIRGNRLQPLQLLEVREAIDAEIAGLAAERAEPDEIQALEATVDVLRRKNVGRKDFVDSDLAFNRCLAAATHNPLFQALAQAINGVLRPLIEEFWDQDGAVAQETSLEDHGRILQCVKEHDVAGARRAAAREIERAHRIFRTGGDTRARVGATKPKPSKRGRQGR